MADAPPAAPRKGALLIVFLTVVIDLIGFGIVIPILPFYAREFGASEAVVGLVLAIFSLFQLVCAPLLGRLSDRIGRRPILLLGLGGSCASYLLFALADDLTLLFVSRALAGAFAATVSTAQAYVADVTTPENRARGMGMIGAAFGIGFVIGPFLGGALAEVHSAAPGLFAAGLSLTALTFGAFKLPESRARGARPVDSRAFSLAAAGAVLADPRRRGLILVFFALTLGFAAIEGAYPFLADHLLGFGKAEAGYALGLIGLAVVLAQGGLIRPLVRRHSERAVLTVGLVALGVTAFLLARSGATAAFLGVSVALGLAYGVASPSLFALLSKNAPRDEQGGTFGVSQSFGSLARLIGHAGALAAFGVRAALPFTLGGALLVAVALWFRSWRRKFPHDPADAGSPARPGATSAD